MLNRHAVSLQSLFSIITHSSLNHLGSFRALQMLGQARVSANINLASGKLIVNDCALKFSDLSGNIECGYIYTGQSQEQPWQILASRMIKQHDKEQRMVVLETDGTERIFQFKNGQYEFADSDGLATIKYDEASQTYVWHHAGKRVTEYFSMQDNRVHRSVDAQGFTTKFEYENSKLSAIVAPSEICYSFTYTGDEIIVKRKTETDEQVVHVYHLNQNKGDDYLTNYEYQDKTNLTAIKQSDGSEFHFSYYLEGEHQSKLQKICMGDKPSDAIEILYQGNNTTLLLPSGETMQLTFNSNQQITDSILCGQAFHYEYNSANQVEKISYPDKSVEIFEYHPVTGLITKHTKRDGNYEVYEYSDDAEPVLIRHSHYAAGSKTPQLVSCYVYAENSINGRKQLRYEISQRGAVREYAHNDKGLIACIRDYLTDKMTIDISSPVPSCTEVGNWKSDLNKKQIPPQIHYTMFEYEQDAQVKRKCEFSALLSDGTGDRSQPFKETEYEHDAKRNELLCATRSTSSENDFLKIRREFDSLNRINKLMIGCDTPLLQTTKQQYKKNEISLTHPNNQADTRTMNASGLLAGEISESLESKKEIVESTIERHYQCKMNVISHSDLTKEYEFTDATDRIVGRVGKSGQVTKTEYCEGGRYRKETAFAKQMDIDSVDFSKGWIEPETNDEDREVYKFFGFNDEVRFEVDADGYLKEYRYHLNHEIAHAIQYAKPITAEELEQLKRGEFLNRQPNRLTDRINSSFYDEDGHLLAEQDGAGYISEYERDAGGRPVKKTTYNNPTLDFTDDFTNLKLIKNQQKDAEHYYFYNNLNQCDLEIDALGHATAREYELDGKTKQETKYYQPVNLADWKDKSTRPTLTPSAKDQTTTFEYDDLRRVQTIKSANGEICTLGYDEMNHQTSVIHQDDFAKDKSDGDHYRGKLKRYNSLGQVVATLNEFAAKMLQEIDGSLSSDERQLKIEEIWNEFAERYEYNIDGLKVKTTDALGKVTRHYYDKDRNPVLNIDATGAVTEIKYNAFGEEVEEIRYLNRISADTLAGLNGGFMNDAVSKCYKKDPAVDQITIKKRNKLGLIRCLASSPTRLTIFSYNAFRQIETETQANENDTAIHIEHEYEGRGLNTRTTKSAAGEESIVNKNEYQHPLGLKTAEEDSCGGRHEFIRDQLGNICEEKQRNEDGEMTVVKACKYDAFGRPTDISNADKESTHIDYNEQDRSETTTLADGVSKKRVFKNVFGDITRTQYISAENQIIFDSLNEHAPDGQISALTDGTGNRTEHRLNVIGLEESTLLPDKSEIKSEYNDAHVLNKIITDVGTDPENLNITKCFEIDALHRREKIFDALNHMTTCGYTPQGECETTTRDMGENRPALVTKNEINVLGDVNKITQGDSANQDQLTVKKLRDGYGRVREEITAPDKLDITKKYTHDNAGRVIKFVDPEGHVTRSYYNQLGQLRYELKPVSKTISCLVERRYSPAGKLIERRVHRLAVPVEKITDATQLKNLKKDFPGTEHDQITRYFHDQNGREKFKLKIFYDIAKKSWQAIVTEKAFDAVGRENMRHQYANLLTIADIEELTTSKLTELTQTPSFSSPSDDRIRFRHYNAASQCRYTVDQDGYVTEKIYNAMGKVITVKQYEDPVTNPASFNAANFSGTGKCRYKHAIYDGAGREIFSIAANGQLIRKDYDKNDNLISLCRFKNTIDVSLAYNDLVKAAKARVPDAKSDSIVQRSYDYANRMETATDEIGNKDEFQLNAIGNIELHTDRNGQDYRNEFDEAQRKIREWSPATTFALVTENNGKLEYKNVTRPIAKKFDLDQNGNAIKITKGEGLGDLVERSVEIEYGAAGTTLGSMVHKVEVANDDVGAEADGVITTDVTTSVIVNEQGLKIAERNEDNHWNYYIRDAFGRIIYTIQNEQLLIAHHYNAFGLEDKTIQYQTPIARKDWSLFRDSSQVLNVIDLLASHPENPEEDRVTCTQYYPSGKVKSKTTSKLFYYHNGKSGEAEPVTIMQYNRFGELVYDAKLLSPDEWAEKAIWRDAAGRPVLEIDENRYVTYYIRDAFGRVVNQIEYSNALSQSANINLKELYKKPLEELLGLIEKDAKLDRVYLHEYDLRGDKVGDKLLDVKASELQFDNKNIPSLIEIMRETVGKRYIMSNTQKCLQVLLETGVEAETIILEQNFFDERDIKVATLGQARTRKNPPEADEVITPLTKIIPNAHGEAAVKQTSPKGSILGADKKPAFAPNAEVIEEIAAHDKRGKENVRQNGAGVLTSSTFTASGKTAAKTVLNKKYEKENGVLNENTIRMIKTTEKVKYHPGGDIAEQYHIADGVVEQALVFDANHFGENIGARNINLPSAEFKQRDASGRIWKDNSDERATKIRLRDLQGHVSGILSAEEIDLSTKTLKDIPALLQADRKAVLLEQISRDKKGGLIDYRSASSYRYIDNHLPTYSQTTDRWNNHTSKSDSRGYTTNFESDKRDNVTAEIKPETAVRKADGTNMRLRPTTKFGFNIGNGLIGKIDARGYCEAYRLDEANQTIERILADGVLDKRFVYDALGRIEMAFNSKNGRYVYHYDANNDVIELNLPEGGTFQYRYDQRRHRIYIQTPHGYEHRMNHSIAGDVIEAFTHLGELTRMIYNHRHQLMAEANADGTSRKWALDFFGLADNHIDMSGRVTMFQRNYISKVKAETTSCSPALESALLNHGYIYAGPYTPQPYLKLQKYPAWPQEMNAIHKYEYGQRVEIEDVTENKIEKSGFDSDGRLEEFTVIERDTGQLVRHINQTHTELGHKDVVKDTNYICNTVPTTVKITYVRDEDSHTVAREVEAERPRYHPACVVNVDRYEWANAIDPVGRATVVNGDWTGGVVKHATERGMTLIFDEKDGTRTREFYDASATTHRDAKIKRDSQMRIENIDMNNGLNENRVWSKGDWLHMREVISSAIYQEGDKNRYNRSILMQLDGDQQPKMIAVFDSKLAEKMKEEKAPDQAPGFPPGETPEKIYGKKWSTAEYVNTPDGAPLMITTTFSYDHLTTVETKSETYASKESLQEAAVTITVRNKHNEHPSPLLANFGFNHNFDPVTKPGWDEDVKIDGLGSAIQEIFSPKSMYLDRTHDGKILNKYLFVTPIFREPTLSAVLAPIMDVAGNVEGVYRAPFDAKNADLDYQHHAGVNNAPEQDILIPAHIPFSAFIEQESQFDFPDAIQSTIQNQFQTAFASVVPKVLRIQSGDTLESIARTYYGHARYAEDIAMHNGLLSSMNRRLAPGNFLYMPHISPDRLQEDAAMPYYLFANKVVGRLNPIVGIPMPKVHHANFFAQFVKMVALALVVVYAPVLASALIGAMTGVAAAAVLATPTLTLAGVSAVIGGIGDAAIQGLAVGLGVQEKFSVAEVLETAVTAGMASGGVIKLNPALEIGAQAMNAVKIASIQVNTQLIEMAIGARDKFDAAAVGEQVLAALAATQISDKIANIGVDGRTPAGKVAINVATTASNAVIGSVTTHTPISVQQLTAQAISGTIQSEASDHLNRQLEDTSFVNDTKPELIKISDPVLPLPKTAYGETSYAMGVLNQKRMASEHVVIEKPQPHAPTKVSSYPNRFFSPSKKAVINSTLGIQWKQTPETTTIGDYISSNKDEIKNIAIDVAAGLAIGAAAALVLPAGAVAGLGGIALRLALAPAVDMASIETLSAAASVTGIGMTGGAGSGALFSLFGRSKVGASLAEPILGTETLRFNANKMLKNVFSELEKAQGGIDSTSINSAEALSSKLSAIQKAQSTASKIETMPDGSVRYYLAEVPSRTSGVTRGASYVTEYNPTNGTVKSWMESYDYSGGVTRIHPKMLNGQTLNSPHFPPTARELHESQPLPNFRY